jgi:hypothetical protein
MGVSFLFWGCGGDDEDVAVAETNGFGMVKATCGPGDTPEPALQGQVPAAMRVPGGFKGASCNLQLIGQSRNDGASWQHDWFADKAGHKCNYYDTSIQTANRTHLGVAVIDATNPAAPKFVTSLETAALLDPWESLKVNERRQMLGGVRQGGNQFDLYDIGGNCLNPQLLFSGPVGLDDGSGGYVAAVTGHEGNFAPDGLTYYGANLGSGYIYPIDISNPTKPKMLTQYVTAPGRVHGLDISDDGNRGYLAIAGTGAANPSRAPGSPDNNGLLIIDTSQVQARVPNPQIRVVSVLVWGDGGGAQHAIPIKIGGKPYVIQVDEGGSGPPQNACDAGLALFPMARIIDLSDETKPFIVSKLGLETHDPKNCDKVLPDLVGISGFIYGAHYCSVDNKKNATTLACGYFENGIRVFDIRNPAKVREIAYYNPPSVTTPSSGSQNMRTTATGRPDHCSALVRLDVATQSLQTTCQDNGFLSLKFTNGAWPFPESSTPPGEQN